MRWDDGVIWFTDLVTPPTGRSLNVEYFADQHLRTLTDGAEDDRLRQALEAAESQAEHYMQRAIRDQTWALLMDRFPTSGCIALPYPPLVSVTSIQYVDEDGATQTLATSEYRVIRERGPKARRSVIERAYNVTWPGTRTQRDAVTVTFRAGYIDTSASPEVTNVPADILDGIAMRAAELYKQRSDSVMGVGVTTTPAILASRNLWHDYKVY